MRIPSSFLVLVIYLSHAVDEELQVLLNLLGRRILNVGHFDSFPNHHVKLHPAQELKSYA